MQIKISKIKNNKIWVLVGGIVLGILPLLRINIGVDITDVGYSLGNFENFNSMGGMWVIATYLSNVIGHMFTLLPFGHSMLGMNFYTGVIVSMILVFSFLFLRKVLPTWIVFIGEILSFFLCWCPTAILYNYLTYFIMTLALYFLYKGLVKDKTLYLIFAGVLLGVNVFVRFPNLVELGFIVIVWYDTFLQKKGWKIGLIDTLKCIGGYVIGIGTMFVVVLAQYGWKQYEGMLSSLADVGSNIKGYGPLSMIKNILLDYIQHIRWIWMAVLCVVIVQFIYSKLKNKIMQGITCVFGGSIFAGIFFLYYKKDLFSYNRYNDYTSIFFWAIFFLTFSIGINIFLLTRKEESREIKLLAITSMMIIVLTSLGSNNSVYPNFNNLFLVAPVTLYGIYQYMLRKKFRKTRLPLQVALYALLAILMVQSFMFKAIYTFRDVGLSKELDTVITKNEVLQGMKTSSMRAENIESLTIFIEKEELGARLVLMFGYAPSIPYMLQLTPEISTTWPDLPSYSYENFVCELSQVKHPLVIIYSITYPNILEYLGNEENRKAALVATFLTENKYKVIYEGAEFKIYDMR
jgi:hypothetical protein